jgi:glutamine---fructose-6-phosphate transaminase (isomerizing)
MQIRLETDMSQMLKEICEQPAALERLLKNERKNIRAIAENIRRRSPAFFSLSARGSSDNAATYGKYLFEYANSMECSLAAPSIYTVYRRGTNLKHGVAIGISQSGEGTDINEVLAAARKSGAYTIGITNSPNSAIADTAEDIINLNAGLEKGLAATKTYTCQLLALMILSGELNQDKTFLGNAERLPDQVNETLKLEAPLTALCERYRYMDRCVIIGRGFNYATVKEAALKLMETSYVVAQPFSTADFLHGPIAMTGAGFPTFICVPEGKMAASLHELCDELRKKELETVIVSTRKNTLKLASKKVEIPVKIDELVSPMLYIVPFQFLANALSQSKGIDPDHPRFLKKVTRTF